jgi:hypothetical protein
LPAKSPKPGEVSARRDHQIVQTEFKAAGEKSPEADPSEHLPEHRNGYALLVLVALHLIADKVQPVKHTEDGIDHRGGPSENERAAGSEETIRFAENAFGFGQMLEDSQHDDVIERPLGKWQR